MAEVVDLDRAVLRPLWMALSRHAEEAETRVNPTAFEEDGRIWFLGPTATEPLLSVPATEPVKAALAEPARALADIGLVELVPPYGEHDDDPLAKLGVEEDAKAIRDLLAPRRSPTGTCSGTTPSSRATRAGAAGRRGVRRSTI